MACPRCDHDNPQGAAFCTQCGAALGRTCPGCGAPAAATQNFCSACGAALGAPAGAGSGADDGERRQATVVFSDLSGYTALNEQLDPEEVEEIMGRVKRAAIAIVERHGGTVNQFVGDEIMALFGIPVARRDDPSRAVRAALELHQALRGISATVAPRIGRALTMHTGINSGLVIVRRSDLRGGRYQLTGDTVNTAARLLKLAQGDQIVVGQDTWREIRADFDAEAGEPTEVRGKEHPIVPWRIRAPIDQDRALQRRALIGRGLETRQFHALARTALDAGHGAVVVLRGEPGIGKSHLAAECCALAGALGCSVHTALVLDFSAEHGRDATRALARALHGGGVPGATSSQSEVFLADLLDQPLRPDLLALAAAIDESTRNRGTVDALRDLALAAAARQPVCVLIEDLHWADDWTIERIAAIAGATATCRLLLIVTTRADNDPTARLTRPGDATQFDLQPLTPDDALALAAQFPEVPAGAARTLVERADGNPLFLEQLLINVGAALTTALPGSIQALVLARMDRLGTADRAVLQAAAVLGQRFSLDALRHVVEQPELDCRTLLEQRLLRPDGEHYLFWHALIRDGAYEALLKSRRRQWHARAAEWFGAREPARAAEHFDRAEDTRAPLAYLGAADAEAARFRFERALELARRGRELAQDPADRHQLASREAHILLEAGLAQESIVAWQAAMELAPDDSARCTALIGTAAGMRIVDRAPDGLAALEAALPLAQADGMELQRSRLHHLRGNLYFGLGRIDECLQEHEAALREALVAGSTEAEASALGGLGDAHYMRARMRSAQRQFGQCVELARRNGLVRIEVANLHMLAWTTHYLNDIRGALELEAQALDLALTVAHRRAEIIARSLAAYIGGWITGDVEPAQRHIERALVVARELGAKRFEGQLLGYDALLALRRGERATACDKAREALAFNRAHGSMRFFGPVVLGLVARTSADPDETARHNAEAMDLLAHGALSHNQFEFCALAIDGALERRAWDEAERYCAALEAYTAGEPLPWSELLIARGRGLAEFGRGRRDAGLLAELRRIRNQAASVENMVALPALDTALGIG